MKGKYVLLSTVLTLALTMTACGSAKTETIDRKSNTAAAKAIALSAEESYVVEESMVGYYKAIKMTNEGEDITSELEQLNEMGGGIFLIIDEDYNGEINLLGEITKFYVNVAEETFVVLNEEGEETEKINYEFDEGNIKLSEGIEVMEFTRMSIDEIEAFKNGDSGKSIDDIIDKAFDEAADVLTDENTDDSYLPDLSEGKHEDAGYYEITEFKEDEEYFDKDQLNEAGVEFDMLLCPDGTGYAHFIGNYYDLSWEDGTIYVATELGQEKITYSSEVFEGKDVITINEDNISMVFEFVAEADETYEWQRNSDFYN